MAVGLDDIQTELADLDIEVNIAYQYQKLLIVRVVKNYFCKFFLHAGIKSIKIHTLRSYYFCQGDR